MMNWASATALVFVQWFNFSGTGLVEPWQTLVIAVVIMYLIRV